MRDIKDVFQYLDSFDENNLFDFKHNKKFLYSVSEVLRSQINRRGMKHNLTYCEEAILNLIDLTVKITHMNTLNKPGILREIENCMMVCYTMKLIVIRSVNPLNLINTICYQKIVILAKL